MKVLNTTIAFIMFYLSGISQDVDLNFSTIENDINLEEYHYTLADNINVRNCPSLSCKKTGMLRIGERIILEERSENVHTINDVKSNWYKIQAEGINGWIFGSFIAQHRFGSLFDSSVKFVFGLKSIDHSEGWDKKIYQIRAIKDNQEIDRLEFPIFSSYFNSVKTIGNVGLDLRDVIIIDVPCEGGCGCTSGELVVFWNGKEFSEVEDLLGTADAWASESKEFIYPIDKNGIPNMIVRVSDFYIEELSDNKIRRQKTKEYLKWNGTKLIPAPSMELDTHMYITDK